MVIWETLCVNRLWFYARLSMRDTAVPRLRDTQHFDMAPYPLRKNAAFKVKQTVSARSRFVAYYSILAQFHLDGPTRVGDTVFPNTLSQLAKIEAL